MTHPNVPENFDVGIDLTSISRFEKNGESMARHFLSEREEAEYNCLSERKKQTYLATRWAAKEAIFKITQNGNFKEYSVLNEENGKPCVCDHPEMKISISHEGDLVVAIVIMLK